jgi:chromosome segregation ATPase
MYHTVSNRDSSDNEPAAAKVNNDQSPSDTANESLNTVKAERDAHEQAIVTPAELSSLRDRLSSTDAANISMRNAHMQLDQLNRSCNKAERDALKQTLATQAAELSSLRDRLSSADAANADMRNYQIQFNTVTRSLNTTKAERDALKQVLTTQEAELSYLQDQLSSANAANDIGTLMVGMLGQRVHAQANEVQIAEAELGRVRNELKVTKFEMQTSILALRFEVADLKFQNSQLTSEMEGRVSRSARTTNATAGPSRVTSEKSRRSLSNSPKRYLEFDEEIHRLRTQRDRFLRNTQPLVTCGVCMDKHPEDYITPLDPCGHKFCRDCIKNHIGAKLEEHGFPILCPVCTAEGDNGDPGGA